MSENHSIFVGRRCTIYFIQVGQDGPIKIGRCRDNPQLRCSALQVSVPWELRLIATIVGVRSHWEGELHRRFRHLHMRGEWFQPGTDLLEFIARTATPWADIVGWRHDRRDKQNADRIAKTLANEKRGDFYLSRNTDILQRVRSGVPVPLVARQFRLSIGYVYQIIRGMPESSRCDRSG